MDSLETTVKNLYKLQAESDYKTLEETAREVLEGKKPLPTKEDDKTIPEKESETTSEDQNTDEMSSVEDSDDPDDEPKEKDDDDTADEKDGEDDPADDDETSDGKGGQGGTEQGDTEEDPEASDADKDADPSKSDKVSVKGKKEKIVINPELAEALKVNDIVYPKIGPHKGQAHRIIHVFPDGTVNITPTGHSNRYHLGAAKARPRDLDLHEAGVADRRRTMDAAGTEFTSYAFWSTQARAKGLTIIQPLPQRSPGLFLAVTDPKDYKNPATHRGEFWKFGAYTNQGYLKDLKRITNEGMEDVTYLAHLTDPQLRQRLEICQRQKAQAEARMNWDAMVRLGQEEAMIKKAQEMKGQDEAQKQRISNEGVKRFGSFLSERQYYDFEADKAISWPLFIRRKKNNKLYFYTGMGKVNGKLMVDYENGDDGMLQHSESELQGLLSMGDYVAVHATDAADQEKKLKECGLA